MPEHDEDYGPAIERALRAAEREREAVLEPEQARELAEYLATLAPRQQQMVLRNSATYRRLEVFFAWVWLCEERRREAPLRTLRLAAAALRLFGQGLEETPSRTLWNDARAAAWLALGNARRMLGRYRRAQTAFTRAGRLLARGTGDPLLAARRLSYRASLKIDCGRFDDAIELLLEAKRRFEKTGDRHQAGAQFMKLAQCYWCLERTEDALEAHFAAMQRLEVARDPALVVGCLTNFVRATAEVGRPEEAQALLADWGIVFALGESDPILQQLRWVDARIAVQLKQYPRAIRGLNAVRRAFEDLESPYYSALASLDLAALYAHLGQMREVKRLAEEMVPLFLVREVHREARLAFELWYAAARAEVTSESEIRGLAGEIERVRGAQRRGRLR